MPYIPMTDYETAGEDVRARYDDQIAKHGRITNMKRTLLHSLKAFDVYMEWYPLADLCKEFIGARALSLYAYAISEGNRCLVCGAFFRKLLIDSGDDPDAPVLSQEENLLMELGFSIAEDPHNIDPDTYAAVRARYDDEQVTLLFAFAGIMAATNLFNTVARVPLDEVLYKYQKKGPRD
jgi:alkylhydroperoxidase family enzyme